MTIERGRELFRQFQGQKVGDDPNPATNKAVQEGRELARKFHVRNSETLTESASSDAVQRGRDLYNAMKGK